MQGNGLAPFFFYANLFIRVVILVSKFRGTYPIENSVETQNASRVLLGP